MGIIPPTRVKLRDGCTITLRSPGVQDAAAVIESAKRIFAQTDLVLTKPEEFTLTVEEEAALLTRRAESPTGVYLIAEEDTHAPQRGEDGERDEPGRVPAARIIAISGLDPMTRLRAMHNVTLGIMVDSAWQRRGVGHAMMQALMDWARRNPAIRRVQLEVIATNTHAIRLYERHGFVIEGRRVGCFQRRAGIFEDDYIMAADVTTSRQR